MSAMEHIEWLTRITSGDSMRQVAERAEVPLATISHQTRKGTLKPEVIIKIAEAYNESPVYALVDLGFISARWISEPGIRTALSRATDEQLTDELLRRLRLIEDTPVDELASRRSSTQASSAQPVEDYANTEADYDGTVGEFAFSPEQYAADSTEDVTEMRLERGEDPID